MTTERAPASYWADICRGNLAATRRDLCSHGIRPDTCKDRHDQPETEESADA